MKITIKFLLSGVFIVTLFALVPILSYGEQSFESSQYGFTIEFPDGWILKDGVAGHTVVKAVYKDFESHVAMVTVTAINMEKGEEEVYKNSSAKEFADSLKKEFAELNPQIIDYGKIEIDGKSAFFVKHRFSVPDVINSTNKAYSIPYNDILYVVSATANSEIFDEMESTLMKSLNSFKFLKAPLLSKELNKTDSQLPETLKKKFQPSVKISKKSGESPLASFLKAFGRVFIMFLLFSAIVGFGKYLLKRCQRNKS